MTLVENSSPIWGVLIQNILDDATLGENGKYEAIFNLEAPEDIIKDTLGTDYREYVWWTYINLK
jgi:hypothetical protein